MEEPAVGQHAQKARSSPRGHPPLQEPARLLRVTLVPERSTLAAWRPKRGHCGGTLALATVADTMRVISRSGEQLFARHQFGAVHMHRLEVCALTLTCSKAPCALRPAPCTLQLASCRPTGCSWVMRRGGSSRDFLPATTRRGEGVMLLLDWYPQHSLLFTCDTNEWVRHVMHDSKMIV